MRKLKDKELLELQNRFPSALSYLSSILLIEREHGKVGNTKLANRLRVSKPAANQAMSRLKKLELAQQDPYGSIKLTKEGKRFASAILKRHFLIEHLLISKMDYPWADSDKEAQRMENSLSEEFCDYLFEYFGQPATCPHGNPFPGSKNEEKLVKAPRLTGLEEQKTASILRITEEGENRDGLLDFCYKNNIMPGAGVHCLSNTEGEIEVEIEGKKFSIPKDIAQYICYTL